MALLTLKDIGKIYVSEGNVSVGIRGVNLTFERGEFVAVTGKSGSGKSTLLNVISGIDTYEEGELFVEGQPTSHYLQPEWEEYREKYISFIFQDYNIIESFTVLQNVELALMHIEDKKERRRRALELIDRVGLSSHVKHKGSRLSGGQKQRTVIARALAKDSPIILADEPTGNLDSATSKEIIDLLHEVSKEKLLIVVTHNFEQVEECATRHIRIFDGAVEFDHTVRKIDTISENKKNDAPAIEKKKKEFWQNIKNGVTLGSSIFASKPKLSFFLCCLMIIGAMGIFLVTSLCGEAADAFKPHYMFNHIDGRLVLAKQNGTVFTEGELQEIRSKYGAESYLHYDILLDDMGYNQVVIPTGEEYWECVYLMSGFTYGKDYGEGVIGRYPEACDEMFLYLPITYQPIVGKDSIEVPTVYVCNAAYKLVGVKYYYDNNLRAECMFTEDGFRTATAMSFLSGYSGSNTLVRISSENGNSSYDFSIHSMITSFDMPADKIFIDSTSYESFWKNQAIEGVKYTTAVDFSAVYYKYDYYNGESKSYVFTKSFGDSDITSERPDVKAHTIMTGDKLIISDELLLDIAEDVLEKSYVQASVFFENDKRAHEAAEKLKDEGYIAVPSDTTYEPDSETVIFGLINSIAMIFAWSLAIIFLAFFINLCSSRTLGAFKGEMAIMRSMGIPVKAIRIGMYVRMLIAVIPAFVAVGLSAYLIFTSPVLNEAFIYLYPWQYALIFIGLIALTVRTTHSQIRRLFGESVKKSLKGGSAQ